jgi:hypothetical protein
VSVLNLRKHITPKQCRRRRRRRRRRRHRPDVLFLFCVCSLPNLLFLTLLIGSFPYFLISSSVSISRFVQFGL